jgi:hypothetical protein
VDDSPGWLPCSHEWVETTELSDENPKHVCSLCGESMWDVVNTARGGWRYVETNIDTIDDHVRMTIIEVESRRIVYSARYTPDIAREMAYNLTLKALELEDA